jgi:ribosomal protein S18 acetylase RimI-like enzyme
MTQDPRVELEDHASAEALFEPICQLYREAFSQPPFNRSEAQHQAQADQLRQLLTNPTFELSTAYVGDELVGFLYGIRLRPGTAWWDDFLSPVPEEITREWEGRTFALIYLAVASPWRRQGIGRRLVSVLLASRPEERATVSAIPEAKATQAFYRALGWRYVGRQKGTPGQPSALFDTYVLPLGSRKSRDG